MAIDESFVTPGSVPFKWEIRPGVPKVQHQEPPPSYHHHNRSTLHHKQHSTNHYRSSPSTQQKLTPPPAGFNFQPSLEPRTRSLHSVPRTRSQRNKLIFAQPEVVSAGCFTRPLMTRKEKKNKSPKLTTHEFELEISDYTSDLETLSRWSVSTRKSLSPFRGDSPLSSSFSSYQSSPRPVSDAEWAGFGLF